MSKPSEHKTVQARILAYAQEIGWTLVTRAEAERRRGFESDATTAEERARRATLYFGGLLHGQRRAFNLQYQEAEGASIGQVATLAVQHPASQGITISIFQSCATATYDQDHHSS